MSNLRRTKTMYESVSKENENFMLNYVKEEKGLYVKLYQRKTRTNICDTML
jgi:hypothetical protein